MSQRVHFVTSPAVAMFKATSLLGLALWSWGCSEDPAVTTPPPLVVIESRDQLRADQTALMWLEAYMLDRLDEVVAITHPIYYNRLPDPDPYRSPNRSGDTALVAELGIMKSLIRTTPVGLSLAARVIDADRDASIVAVSLEDEDGQSVAREFRILLSKRGDERWWVIPPVGMETSLGGGDSGQSVEIRPVDQNRLVTPASENFLTPQMRDG